MFPTTAARRYRARRPENTPLYHVVQHHFETWLVLKRADDAWEDTVPAFVERDSRKYLECGIFARGFGRARCTRCGHDFLVAFSCRARAVCPSCNARRMVETAAHLVDHVFPPLPVRQWVLSVPKRLRYFLERDPQRAGALLRIFLRVIEAQLRQSSPGAGDGARLGAVSFVHRFGSSVNQHLHYHIVVLDGVFAPDADGRLPFYEATGLSEADIATVQARVRARVLKWMVRQGLLESHEARAMRDWGHGGGFSLDASVRVEAWDRAGLEKLIRYCARPPFALERLARIHDAEAVLYRLPKPLPDGRTELVLTPLELLERLAALIPPPRVHRHRYHGVLAPNSPWRPEVTAQAAQASQGVAAQPADSPSTEPRSDELSTAHSDRRSARYLWARLLARIYEVFPLLCVHCGAEMRFVAFVTETAPLTHILEHIGEPAKPPLLSPARGPPPAEAAFDQSPLLDPVAPASAPDFEFDQTVTW